MVFQTFYPDKMGLKIFSLLEEIVCFFLLKYMLNKKFPSLDVDVKLD